MLQIMNELGFTFPTSFESQVLVIWGLAIVAGIVVSFGGFRNAHS